MIPQARARPAQGHAALLACALLGGASVPAASMLGETRPAMLLAGATGLFALAGIALAGWLRPALLVGYVLALTYNRQYFGFDWLHGDLGARGFYWGPADACLLALFLLWFVEAALDADARRTRPARPRRSLGSVPWLLPFVVVAALSAAIGDEPVGSVVEVMRYGKLALLLIYLRGNLDARTRPVLVAALGASVLLQAPVAVLQVAFASGQNGLSQLLQAGEPGELARRAAGTLGHPNYLASYMLLLTPAFLAAALAPRAPGGFAWIPGPLPFGVAPARALRWLSACVGAAGVVTIAMTQSRGPVALLSTSLVLLLALATGRRAMPPLRAVALLVVGACALVLVAIPLGPTIAQRLTGDLGASVDFRASYNDVAIRMWMSGVEFGVGPNNFGTQIRHFLPDQNILLTLEELASGAKTGEAHLRTIAPVHNVYLYILAETGALGLIAFVILLARPLGLAWRVSRPLRTLEAWFALGLFCGLLAEYAQQQIDYSLLTDPVLTSLVLLVGLLQSMADDRRVRS